MPNDKLKSKFAQRQFVANMGDRFVFIFFRPHKNFKIQWQPHIAHIWQPPQPTSQPKWQPKECNFADTL